MVLKSNVQWRLIMWSEGSRFTLNFHDNRIHVHSLSGESFFSFHSCINNHNRHGGESVRVWCKLGKVDIEPWLSLTVLIWLVRDIVKKFFFSVSLLPCDHRTCLSSKTMRHPTDQKSLLKLILQMTSHYSGAWTLSGSLANRASLECAQLPLLRTLSDATKLCWLKFRY